MAGLTVALEGVDGCGKSTQVGRLLAWLAERVPGREVLSLREPGGTELGDRVRALLLNEGDETPVAIGARAETLLYMTSRAELYETVVGPALERDALVVLDRSYYSTVAYQGGGLSLGVGPILEMARWVTGERAPDRVLLLRIAPAAAAARRAGSADDRIESRDAAYFERVAAAYDALAADEPERFRVVDASGDQDTVAAAVREALSDVV